MAHSISEVGLGVLGADVLDTLRKQAGKAGGAAKVADAAAKLAEGGDPLAALLGGSKVTFWTNVSDPVVLDGNALLAPKAKPSEPSKGADAYLKLIQPTFVIESPLGKTQLAPGGVADPKRWMLVWGLVAAGVIGLGAALFLLGRASK